MTEAIKIVVAAISGGMGTAGLIVLALRAFGKRRRKTIDALLTRKKLLPYELLINMEHAQTEKSFVASLQIMDDLAMDLADKARDPDAVDGQIKFHMGGVDAIMTLKDELLEKAAKAAEAADEAVQAHLRSSTGA